jgi:hypothetical protein
MRDLTLTTSWTNGSVAKMDQRLNGWRRGADESRNLQAKSVVDELDQPNHITFG